MKKLMFLGLLLAAYSISAQAKVTAEVSINRAIFHEDMTGEAELHFAIRNTGQSAVPVDWRVARLWLNHQEIKNWADDFSPWRRAFGIPPHQFDTLEGFAHQFENPILLPARRAMEFHVKIGHYLQGPGTYVVQWKGKNFKAPPLTFQVRPWWDKKVPDELLLVRAIRAKLPLGWAVFYLHGSHISVESEPVRDPRDYELISEGERDFQFFGKQRAPTKGPFYRVNPQTLPAFGGENAGSDAEDEEDEENEAVRRDLSKFRLRKGAWPGLYRPSFSFTVRTFVSPGEWQTKKEVNGRLRQMTTALHAKLPRSGWWKSGFQPKTPEEAKDYAFYEQLNKAFFALPQFHYRGISLDYHEPLLFGSAGGFSSTLPIFPETEKVEAEKQQLIEMVKALLTRYEPKAD